MAVKWFFNKVILNERTGFYFGIPACILAAVGCEVVAGVVGVFLAGCLAIQLFGFEPLK